MQCKISYNRICDGRLLMHGFIKSTIGAMGIRRSIIQRHARFGGDRDQLPHLVDFVRGEALESVGVCSAQVDVDRGLLDLRPGGETMSLVQSR